MAQIVVIEGPGTGQTHTLPESDTLRLGRADSNEVHIPSDALGELQAELNRRSGKFCIINTHADVDIFINGEPISGERPLNHGDMIMVADVMLLYDEEVYDEEPVGTTTTVEDAPEIEEATVFHRQKFYEDAENLMASLAQTSDPAKYLGSFLKVTNALVENIELDQLLKKILDIIFDVIPADRGTVQMLTNGQMVSVAEKVRGGGNKKVHASRTIIKQVMDTREGVLTRDAMQDDRFALGMSIVEQKIHAALCVPLIHRQEEVLGVIHLDTTSSGRTFLEDHLKLLTGIAMEASLAIQNARLVEEVGEKKRIERELEIANTIQMNLVPKESPHIDGLEVAGVMVPAREVGGDYYDFVESKDGKTMYLVIGDVSGKGVPAGLVMIMARCFFRPLSKDNAPPHEIMTELNGLMHRDTRRDMFMTMMILAYDTAAQTLTWTGAGHEHMLVYRAGAGEVERIPSGGVPLGMRAESGDHFALHTLELNKGDAVLLYTDGVTEGFNSAGDMFGLDATVDLLKKHGHSDPELIVKSCLSEVRSFIGNTEQSDDITLVAFKRI